jgi:type II secretory pathway predicted ATPase ExeA
MYEKHFNLKTKPFAMIPDPASLYPSSQHSRALTMMEYAIASYAPFCVLTGNIGSGKTTLLRHFLRKLGAGFKVGLISNTHVRFDSIHPWVLSALEIVPCDDSDIAQYEALVDYFVRQYAQGRRTLLVVDEAHNLSAENLEELRLLSNINSEGDISVQVLLVGQPELRSKLESPELEQFAQRVSVDCHLSPLNLQEVAAYILHQLAVAGGRNSPFDREAVAFIYARTGGVPRLINQLCDIALLYAYAERSQAIDVALLQRVLADRHQRGAIPLFGRMQAAELRGRPPVAARADVDSESG